MVRSALLALTFFFSAALLLSQDPLQERSSSALASRTLRQAYFDANGDPPLTLEQGFPHTAGAPLAEPSFLAARARTLAAQRDTRARERLEAGTDVTERVESAFKEQAIKTASEKLTLEPA